MSKFIDTQMRSIWKMVSWRVLLTISHFINGFIITGSWETGAKIAGMAALTNSVLYWGHERVWNRVDAGKKVKDEQVQNA